ncbi:MAG: tetratricopeptide repeat protein [Gemmataceae bacterium]
MDAATSFEFALRQHQQGRLAEAEAGYRRVLQLQPNHFDANCNLGAVLAGLGRLDEAVAYYRTAQRLAPTNWVASFNLGNAWRRAGQYAAALAEFERALQTSDQPFPVLYNLGLALVGLGRFTEARQRLEQALALNPGDAKAWFYLGLALMHLGERDRALESARRAVSLAPNDAEARNLLGTILRTFDRDREAEEHYREAVRLKPNFVGALNNYGLMLLEAGQIEPSLELLRRAIAGSPELHSNFVLALNYHPRLSAAELLAAHRHWAELYADALAPAGPPAPAPPRPDGRLRVGYVSADFRTHPVASFLTAVLPRHDRAAFHVTAYANVQTPDAVTDRLQAAVDVWRPVAGRTNDEVGQMVRDDGIDILVDLSGHTAGNRLQLFARHPAPVQVTLCGYPNTTGLRTIQYHITDSLSDPDGDADAQHTERLFRLPEIGWCSAPPADVPPVSPAPAAQTGRLTFGSLNNLAKVTDVVVATWVRILKAAPTSKLIVVVGQTHLGHDRLAGLFAAAGIDAGRLEFIPRLPLPDYYRLFERIDVALDPFPFNGGVTTRDSLWMGVPVVALAGAASRARQGVCLLTHVGLIEFIAPTLDGYVRIAADLARDPDRLAGIRAQLRDRVRQSPIVQAERYTAHLEAAYRELWARVARP